MVAQKIIPGLNNAAINYIPDKWDKEWFRRFVARWMQPSDVKNATGGVGIAISGNLSGLPAMVSLAANSVTNTQLANMPAFTLKGNNTAASASPSDLTIAQAVTMLAANPGNKIGLAQINGTAASFMRSDSAPALDQTITPTWTALHKFTGSPLQVSSTSVWTGVKATKSADTSIGNSTALVSDADLFVTLNEVGTYNFDVFLEFYEPNSGAGGFQFDLNGGTAAISSIVWATIGYAAALQGNVGATAAGTVQAFSTVQTASASPSWSMSKGQLTISVAGTINLRWAQNAVNINATVLKAKSFMQFVKVG